MKKLLYLVISLWLTSACSSAMAAYCSVPGQQDITCLSPIANSAQPAPTCPSGTMQTAQPVWTGSSWKPPQCQLLVPPTALCAYGYAVAPMWSGTQWVYTCNPPPSPVAVGGFYYDSEGYQYETPYFGFRTHMNLHLTLVLSPLCRQTNAPILYTENIQAGTCGVGYGVLGLSGLVFVAPSVSAFDDFITNEGVWPSAAQATTNAGTFIIRTDSGCSYLPYGSPGVPYPGIWRCGTTWTSSPTW